MSSLPALPDAASPDAVPAASAVLLRDAAAGVEVLLLRRSDKASFAPGAWVFPGGRVDPGDLVGGNDGSEPGELSAARRAAVRETAEEAGLTVDGAQLRPLSHWLPPTAVARRFRTWILVGRAPDAEVVVDGGEITGHQWARPADALEARDQGSLELLPPTWVTLWTLAGYPSVEAAIAATASAEPERFETRIGRVPGGLASLWHGDAGYGDGDTARPGARHRLWMVDSGWRYERTPSSARRGDVT